MDAVISIFEYFVARTVKTNGDRLMFKELFPYLTKSLSDLIMIKQDSPIVKQCMMYLENDC